MSTQLIAWCIDCLIPIGIGLYLTLARPRIVAKIADPIKKGRTNRVLKICGPLVIASGLLIALTGIPASEVSAIQAAQMISTSMPKMVDTITRFDRATAGPGQRVVIEETVTTMRATDVSKEAWRRFLPELRKNITHSKFGWLPEKGITVVYRILGKDGVLIDDVTFTPANTKK